MAIYTRRGDTGKTRIYGSRDAISKTNQRIESLGTIDELNAHVGMVLVYCTDKRVRKQLTTIQRDIFEIGAELATTPGVSPPYKLRSAKVATLERWIDFYWAGLAPLAHFIFPGGSEGASQSHIARTVCRRAERRVLQFAEKNTLNPVILAYLNRLSDYFLTLARWLNKSEGIDDTIWIGTSRKSK